MVETKDWIEVLTRRKADTENAFAKAVQSNISFTYLSALVEASLLLSSFVVSFIISNSIQQESRVGEYKFLLSRIPAVTCYHLGNTLIFWTERKNGDFSKLELVSVFS